MSNLFYLTHGFCWWPQQPRLSRSGACAPASALWLRWWILSTLEISKAGATLGFIGVSDAIIIRAENIGKGADARDTALAAARREISALAA